MKVLVVSHMYPSRVAPTKGAFIHRHVRALADSGIRVRVAVPVPWVPPGVGRMSPRWAGYLRELRDGAEHEGIPVVRLAYAAPPRPVEQLGSVGLSAALKAAWRSRLAGFRPDVIHAHAITPDGFAACQLGRLADVPVLVSARGSEIHETPYRSRLCRWLTRRTVRQADRVLAVSGALATHLRRLTAGEASPRVIYNGVGEDFQPSEDRAGRRSQFGIDASNLQLVYVGRCELDKGVIELIEAFCRLADRHPSLTLRLVGSGGALGEVRKRVAEAGLTGRVTLTGAVSPPEVVRHLQVADLFVFPSYGEGMPNALLEAMAVGLPCVATDVGGIPEVIEPGVSGLLIPPRNADALHGALESLIGDRDRLLALGNAARARVRKQFSWAANARQHQEVYREVIESWKKRKQQRP